MKRKRLRTKGSGVRIPSGVPEQQKPFRNGTVFLCLAIFRSLSERQRFRCAKPVKSPYILIRACTYGISFLLCKNAHIWSNRSVKERFFYALQSFPPTALMAVGFWLYIAVQGNFIHNAKTEKIALCCRLTIRVERFFVFYVTFGHP